MVFCCFRMIEFGEGLIMTAWLACLVLVSKDLDQLDHALNQVWSLFYIVFGAYTGSVVVNKCVKS